MKGERLGEFEELILLALQALDDDAHGVPVQQYVERVAGRPVSIGAVYATLDRLEVKGFVESSMGDVTPERGGKRKRLFAVTPLGKKAVAEMRRIRERIWRAIESKR